MDAHDFAKVEIPDRYRIPAPTNAAVAHQVEQQTENLCVAGSSPARGTIYMPLPSAAESLAHIFGGTARFSTPVVQRTGHHATNVGMEVRFLPGVPDNV
jgi:hypothetical protein